MEVNSSPLIPSSPPDTGDASVGLDPWADVDHHVEGRRWLPEMHLSGRNVQTRTREASASGSRRGKRRRRSQRSTRVETDDVDSLPPSSDSEVSTTSSSSSSSSSHAAKKPSSSFKSRPPTGSLSLSIFSPNISFRRRMSLLASSLAVNACLPFVNGIMLGTGEIVARAVLVPTLLIGWSWMRQRGQKV